MSRATPCRPDHLTAVMAQLRPNGVVGVMAQMAARYLMPPGRCFCNVNFWMRRASENEYA